MKKLLTILAAIMVATLALVGCGGNQEAAKQDAKVLRSAQLQFLMQKFLSRLRTT